MNAYQRKVVRNLKGFEEHLLKPRIPIRNDKNEIIGWFKPVTMEIAQDEKVLALLAKWRQRYMGSFLTQFTATPQRTKAWLQDSVLQDDTRIFFLILTEDNIAVGNYGICNITEDSAELDNLIRGETIGNRRLIYFAELCLTCWLYDTLGIEDVYLHVLTNNYLTIALHKETGFLEEDVFRLTKTESGGELRYVVGEACEPIGRELGYMRMKMDKAWFIANYPWLV